MSAYERIILTINLEMGSHERRGTWWELKGNAEGFLPPLCFYGNSLTLVGRETSCLFWRKNEGRNLILIRVFLLGECMGCVFDVIIGSGFLC